MGVLGGIVSVIHEYCAQGEEAIGGILACNAPPEWKVIQLISHQAHIVSSRMGAIFYRRFVRDCNEKVLELLPQIIPTREAYRPNEGIQTLQQLSDALSSLTITDASFVRRVNSHILLMKVGLAADQALNVHGILSGSKVIIAIEDIIYRPAHIAYKELGRSAAQVSQKLREGSGQQAALYSETHSLLVKLINAYAPVQAFKTPALKPHEGKRPGPVNGTRLSQILE